MSASVCCCDLTSIRVRCCPDSDSGPGTVSRRLAGTSHLDLRLQPTAVSALAASSVQSALSAARSGIRAVGRREGRLATGTNESDRPEAVIRSGCQARGTARASLSVVTHPEHEIFHVLNESMLPFNLISSVVEPHVVHRTLALTCNDLHDVLSKGLAGGISRIA